MPSIKDLKKRIGSVKNTQQTTRAMKMVSAAKLRRAQEAIQNQRPYAHRMNSLIKVVSSLVGESVQSSLLKNNDERSDEATKRKVLLILVTSDRGLCGAFNSNVIKAAQRWVVANSESYSSIKLGFVGRKGYDYFKNKGVELGPYFEDAGGKVTFQKAKKVADTLVNLFTSGEVDEVKFVYNEFKNAVSQQVLVENFLPLGSSHAANAVSKDEAIEVGIYLVKPSGPLLLEQLLAKNFSIQAFRILLDSQASEHGSRMSSMENATKNAGEMIRKLTLQYNKQRQAGITKELLEIIAGSESQKTSA